MLIIIHMNITTENVKTGNKYVITNFSSIRKEAEIILSSQKLALEEVTVQLTMQVLKI